MNTLHFTIQKKGNNYVISYLSEDKKIFLLINSKIAGEFFEENGGYFTKSVNEQNYTFCSTWRLAEQHILDKYFSMFRNEMGVFDLKKPQINPKKTL